MALGRCKNHEPQADGYIGYVKPKGYPSTALICGRTKCNQPALIWLKIEEKEIFDKGIRIFKGPSNFTKMHSKDAFYSVEKER